MLRIKLARFGKKNQPHYRIVVTERKSKRDGQYQALVGRYVPTQSPKILEIDEAALSEWISKGAQPTDTVKSLIDRYKSGNPFPAKKARPSKKSVAKAAAEKEAAANKEAETAPVEETATETPSEEAQSDSTPESEAPAAEEEKAE